MIFNLYKPIDWRMKCRINIATKIPWCPCPMELRRSTTCFTKWNLNQTAANWLHVLKVERWLNLFYSANGVMPTYPAERWLKLFHSLNKFMFKTQDIRWSSPMYWFFLRKRNLYMELLFLKTLLHYLNEK